MAKALVTGGAGFIGSNLALHLETLEHEVTVIDNLLSGDKTNLQGFRGTFHEGDVTNKAVLTGEFEWVFHHGDITDPRHEPQDEIFDKNVTGFQNVLDFAINQNATLVYASTAGLYGNGPTPMKEDQDKQILTEYGRSKLEMDERASKHWDKHKIVGLRYFNVFGPREAAKGRPASMVYHLAQQVKEGKRPRLFEWGEQKRDFVYVKDCVNANMLALGAKSGVYNVGTGVATSFAAIATLLLTELSSDQKIEYFPMPYDKETYQSNTQADLTQIAQELDYAPEWPVAAAVHDYMGFLDQSR